MNARWTRVMRVALPVAALALLAMLSASTVPRPATPALAAPNAFSGPVNGGCFLKTVATCAIHVDRWQPVVPDGGTALVGFRLAARRSGAAAESVLYDFRTDVSNPPASAYLPSLVKKEYAAACGVTYSLSLWARDTGDLSFEEVGRTAEFTCPAAIKLTNFLPSILR